MKLILLVFLLSSCSYFKTSRTFARSEINSFNLPSLQSESQLSCEFVCTNNKNWIYDNHRWFEGKLICKCVKCNEIDMFGECDKSDIISYYYFKAEQPIQVEVIKRY